MTTTSNEARADGGDVAARRRTASSRRARALPGGGPVILATDGTGSSDAPLHAARHAAERLGVGLRVVTVLDVLPIFAGGPEMAIPLAVEEMRRTAREETVGSRVSEVVGSAIEWQLDVRYGAIVTEVAEVARETSASLVVVGSAPHSRFGHQVAGGRAAQLIRTVDCPVWSVDPHPFVAPRSAVVAVDFGRASTRAARAALALLEPGGTLTLLHVLPHREADRGPRDRVEVVECAMRLRQFRDELRPFVPQGTIVETLTISGTVSEVVRRSAEVLGADLVVVGTNGPGLVERLLVGSVAADVLHNPGMTVLACPPDRVAKVRGSGHRAPPGIRTAPAGI